MASSPLIQPRTRPHQPTSPRSSPAATGRLLSIEKDIAASPSPMSSVRPEETVARNIGDQATTNPPIHGFPPSSLARRYPPRAAVATDVQTHELYPKATPPRCAIAIENNVGAGSIEGKYWVPMVIDVPLAQPGKASPCHQCDQA